MLRPTTDLEDYCKLAEARNSQSNVIANANMQQRTSDATVTGNVSGRIAQETLGRKIA